MRNEIVRFLALLITLTSVSSLRANDGIYGSFTVGYTAFEKLSQGWVNHYLSGITGLDSDYPFSNTPSYGGEAHILIAKRFILGGRGGGFKQRSAFNSRGFLQPRTATRSFFTGSGEIGMNLLLPNKAGVWLYPKLGIGGSKIELNVEQSAEEVSQQTVSDSASPIDFHQFTKSGFILDFSACVDWYRPFERLRVFSTGRCGSLFLHGEVGCTYAPSPLKSAYRGNGYRNYFHCESNCELRNFEDVTELILYYMKITNIHFNIGIGFGFATCKKN